MRGLVVWIAVIGCGKSSPGAGSGSSMAGSAVASDARAAAPAAKLLFDDKDNPVEVRIAFDNHAPVLPALSADGAWVARYDSDATMPMFPAPVFISIKRIDGTGKTERLELVELKLATDGPGDSWDDKPPTPAVAKHVRDNGKAAVARLHDFGSLVEVKIDSGSDEVKPTKVGDFTLASVAKSDGDVLEVTLADAKGNLLHRERIKSYSSDEKPDSFMGSSCSYNRPNIRDAYTDQAKQNLYVFIGYHFNDVCSAPDLYAIAWPFDGTKSNVEALEDLVTGQFDIYGTASPESMFTADAQLPPHAKGTNEKYADHDDDDVQVLVSRDGKSAWGSVTTKLAWVPPRDDPWRASSVFVKTPAGWRIAATTWSRPVPNAKANKDAKAGKLTSPPPFTGDAGDAGLRAAFAKLVSDGVDADASARKDLVAIGSADGERTFGGKTFAAGWNAAWKGKTTIISSIARVAPRGTTGWVAANVELAKTGYKIPFHVFCVFDKTAAGAWSLVHVHFAI